MSTDVARLVAELATAGLDLAHAFDAHALDTGAHAPPPTVVPEDGAAPAHPLERWARLARGPRLGLLVGNTRALWSCFVAARASLPADDPLDTYVERAIARALSVATGRGAASEVVFAHRQYDGAFLPFQPLAAAVGLGAPSEGGLVIHPIYGPWFALRAVITVERPPSIGLAAPSPIAKPCACTGACEAAIARARADTGDWRAWLAVRDACTIRAYRYSEDQLRFHYGSAWPAARGLPGHTRDDGSGQ